MFAWNLVGNICRKKSSGILLPATVCNFQVVWKFWFHIFVGIFRRNVWLEVLFGHFDRMFSPVQMGFLPGLDGIISRFRWLSWPCYGGIYPLWLGYVSGSGHGRGGGAAALGQDAKPKARRGRTRGSGAHLGVDRSRRWGWPRIHPGEKYFRNKCFVKTSKICEHFGQKRVQKIGKVLQKCRHFAKHLAKTFAKHFLKIFKNVETFLDRIFVICSRNERK